MIWLNWLWSRVFWKERIFHTSFTTTISALWRSVLKLICTIRKKTLMVDEEYQERAKELISDFIKSTRDHTVKTPAYSFFDKLRIIFETSLFTWFVPGRHQRRLKNVEKMSPARLDRSNSFWESALSESLRYPSKNLQTESAIFWQIWRERWGLTIQKIIRRRPRPHPLV